MLEAEKEHTLQIKTIASLGNTLYRSIEGDTSENADMNFTDPSMLLLSSMSPGSPGGQRGARLEVYWSHFAAHTGPSLLS